MGSPIPLGFSNFRVEHNQYCLDWKWVHPILKIWCIHIWKKPIVGQIVCNNKLQPAPTIQLTPIQNEECNCIKSITLTIALGSLHNHIEIQLRFPWSINPSNQYGRLLVTSRSTFPTLNLQFIICYLYAPLRVGPPCKWASLAQTLDVLGFSVTHDPISNFVGI